MNRGTFISDDADGINGLTQSKCFERSVQEKQMHKGASFITRNSKLVIGGLLLTTGTVNAATITVDAFTDDNTVNTNCTLREAIISANTDTAVDACTSGDAGVDTIILPAGTYTLSLPKSVDNDDTTGGDLDITDDLVIQGVSSSGTPTTVIDADNTDRIFDIFNSAEKGNLVQASSFTGVTVTLENLKLINGLAQEDTVAVDNQANGGAVFSWRFNNLTITNCVFDSNQAVWDGNLAVIPGPDAFGNTDIDERTLSGHGGAVYSRGNLTISNSVFSNNTAYTSYDVNADGLIEGEDEKSGNGGGVFAAYPSTITNTTFSNNSASNGGGVNTTGGDPSTGPDMVIEGSTFVENSAVMGGGVNNVSPQVTLNITNSTFSANTTTDMGGGINSDAAVDLRHVTVVDNQVTNSDQHGAGINYFGPAGQFFLANTLLSNNRGKSINVNCGCTGGTILACSTLDVTSRGGNLSNDFNCGLDSSVGDLTGPDPKVLPLADNGGFTRTHALDFDSLAIDAGLDANCISATPSITTDQRGESRSPLVDGNADGVSGCDIGAYERTTSNTDMLINSFVADATTVSVGDEVTMTVIVANTGPGAVTDARIDVIIPAELSFVSGAVTAGADCTLTGASIISCDLGNLAASATNTVTVVVDAVAAGEISVDAQFAAIESDTDASNNTAVLSLTINPAAADDTTSSSDSSSGGFCSYQPGGRFDPLLPLMVLLSLGYLWRRRVKS